MRRLGGAALALLSVAPAIGAPMDFGGTAEVRAGYGTNPFLVSGQNGGSGLVGFTLSPVLTRRAETSTTSLGVTYNRDQYFRRYDHADDFLVDLNRTQQLSTKLSATAHAGYSSSISAFISPTFDNIVVDPTVIDQLALGQRRKRIEGDAGLSWQPTARDTFTLGVNAEKDSYGGRTAIDYYYYGANGSYSRAISSHTRIGVQLAASKVDQKGFRDSISYSPSFLLTQEINQHWTFNGSIGGIIDREHRTTGGTDTTTSLGFSGSLCGTYPRLNTCITASRQSAPSGIGGLRRQTQIGVTADYQLTEHSRLSGAASYGVSTEASPAIFPRQHFTLARIDYDRDLTRRISAGAGATYQSNTGGSLYGGHSVTVTAHLRAKFGRLQQ